MEKEKFSIQFEVTFDNEQAYNETMAMLKNMPKAKLIESDKNTGQESPPPIGEKGKSIDKPICGGKPFCCYGEPCKSLAWSEKNSAYQFKGEVKKDVVEKVLRAVGVNDRLPELYSGESDVVFTIDEEGGKASTFYIEKEDVWIDTSTNKQIKYVTHWYEEIEIPAYQFKGEVKEDVVEKEGTASLDDLIEAKQAIQFLWDNSKPDHDKTNWCDYFNIPANAIQNLTDKINAIKDSQKRALPNKTEDKEALEFGQAEVIVREIWETCCRYNTCCNAVSPDIIKTLAGKIKAFKESNNK